MIVFNTEIYNNILEQIAYATSLGQEECYSKIYKQDSENQSHIEFN